MRSSCWVSFLWAVFMMSLVAASSLACGRMQNSKQAACCHDGIVDRVCQKWATALFLDAVELLGILLVGRFHDVSRGRKQPCLRSHGKQQAGCLLPRRH